VTEEYRGTRESEPAAHCLLLSCRGSSVAAASLRCAGAPKSILVVLGTPHRGHPYLTISL
jgi:hypothetical protein